MPEHQPAEFELGLTNVESEQDDDGVTVITVITLVEISVTADQAAANVHSNAHWIREGLDRG